MCIDPMALTRHTIPATQRKKNQDQREQDGQGVEANGAKDSSLNNLE